MPGNPSKTMDAAEAIITPRKMPVKRVPCSIRLKMYSPSSAVNVMIWWTAILLLKRDLKHFLNMEVIIAVRKRLAVLKMV